VGVAFSADPAREEETYREARLERGRVGIFEEKSRQHPKASKHSLGAFSGFSLNELSAHKKATGGLRGAGLQRGDHTGRLSVIPRPTPKRGPFVPANDRDRQKGFPSVKEPKRKYRGGKAQFW